MSEFRIYVGEQGLRSENAQLKQELARLRADNARLREMVGEEIQQAAAPLMTDAFARQTQNATIGPLAASQRPAAVVAVMGQATQQQGAFETAEGCRVTIGAAPGNLPQLNPAIAAARAQRGRGPTPVEPEIAAMVKKAEAEVDEDEAVQRFSQMEMK